MAAPQNFRSAFNGFHREDVVHYIEYLNAKHTSEINQLNAQLDLLRSQAADPAQNEELQQQLTASQEACELLQSQLADLQSRYEALEAREPVVSTTIVENPVNLELEARCEALERQLQDALAARTQAETERDSAKAHAAHCRVEQELEAYRRAERTERVAKERAEQVYRQANGALADATVKVDEAFARIGDLTDKVNQQLTQLQQAVTGSRQALADASATLYTIRPGSDIN